MNGTEMGPGAEFDLIRRILGAEQRHGRPKHPLVSVGPGDDCAIVAGLAVTCDLSIEGVHFRRAWLDDDECGFRATAAAISDLAAVAASPIGALVSIAAPEAGLAERVMAGVTAALAASGAGLLGGDVASSPGPVVIDVFAVGECAQPVLRSGGRAGDALWVTGTLGGAAAAVAAWRDGAVPDAGAREAFARPRPRIAEARWLADCGLLTALIDISDGLVGDASHIAAASHARAVLETPAVPVHDAAAARPDRLQLALAGGEDYELLFAAPDGRVEHVRDEFETRFGLRLSRVGYLETGTGTHVRTPDGSAWQSGTGYRHFEEGGP